MHRLGTARKHLLFSAIVLFLTSAATLRAQTYIFGQAGFAVGTQPASVATGDFNNDGILDLVVANTADNTISVLLGKPDGTFNAKTDYATGTQPVSVSIGDFNGDGNLDVAVVNRNCGAPHGGQSCPVGSVSILLGNGDGTFQAHVDYATGTQPVWVATGDFNADGNLDLVVVNQNCPSLNCNPNDNSGSVSILLGNGNGTFQPQVQYITQTNPLAVVVADFNGDHKLDLGVAVVGCGACDGGLSVLLGNGDGTFQKRLDFGTTTPGSSITTGDFNGDGKLDVAIGGSVNSILLGNGDGTFVFDGSYSGGNGTIVSADLNGDGKLDLASGGYILLGNGDGTFQPAIQYGPQGLDTASTVADFNGDGKVDLAIVNYGCAIPVLPGCQGVPGFVAIELGLGDGTFASATSYTSSPLAYLTSADFNGDGHLDLAGETGSGIAVLLGNGDGTFQPQILTTLSQVSGPLVTGDFKNSSETDLATVVSSCTQTSCPPGNAAVLLGNENGTFQAPVDYLVDAGPVSLTAGDFNGDGKLDLAVSNAVTNSVSILLGNGDGTFRTHVDYPARTPGPIVTGDFNGDGKLDLAFLGTTAINTSGVEIMLGNGDGSFQSPVAYATANSAISIAIGDFRADGKLDLAVGTIDGPVSILLGNGDGTFQPYVDYPSGGSVVDIEGSYGDVAVSVGDFNGDGKLDLAMGLGIPSSASILLGNGDGTFQSPLIYTLGNGNGFITVGDFNGDGVPDLAASGSILLSIPFRAVSPTALNFGSQGVGTTSLAQIITISNPSNVQFDISSIAASTSFGQTNNCGPSLKPGASCTVNVTFSPTATGLQQGTLTITDSTRTSPQAVPLTGIGVNGSFLTPYPGRVNFAPQAVGTKSAPSAVMLVNTGNASLSLTSIGIAGANSSDFNQNNNCGISLPAGGSCIVNTTFTPSAEGTRIARLSVNDTATGSPQVVALAGTGADFGISAMAFSPGTIAPGDSATTTVTVTSLNGFSSAVTLLCSGLVSGVSCSFNPSSVTPANDGSATSTLKVDTSGSVPSNAYSIGIVGTSGTNLHGTSQTLTVQGSPDFQLSATPLSPGTVTAGASASSMVTVTPLSGFSGMVDLSCSVSPSVTSAPTCTVPSSVQVTGSKAAHVQLMVATIGPMTTGTVSQPSLPPGSAPFLWTAVLLASAILVARRRRPALATPLMVLACFSLVGCGGGSSSHTTAGTPSGTYTVTVTAKAGSVSNNTNLTVVVQ
jgi:hypothetical protein